MGNFSVGFVSITGPRKTMEDQYFIKENFLGSDTYFLAVFDGHAGREASETAVKNLPRELKKRLGKDFSKQKIEDAINATFKSVSARIQEKTACGSTATVILIFGREIYIAHVGDSGVLLLAKNGQWTYLTHNHNIAEPNEVKILTQKGALVHRGYLWGRGGSGINLSRALGDRDFSEWISSEPDIAHFDIKEDFSHLVLASDGLWNFLDGDSVAAVLKENKKPQEAAELLSELALKGMKNQGWGDNLTAIVISFD